MSESDFIALGPLVILASSSVLIMLLIAMRFNHLVIQITSLILFAISFISLFFAGAVIPMFIEPLFLVDGFGLFVTGLIILSALTVNVISYFYFEKKEEGPKEYYVLLFLCTLGACVLALSKHFISLFLGLEILTVGLYSLIAYLRSRRTAIEAGIKYLVLAAFSSAFLLFGMALVYYHTGSMDFLKVGEVGQTVGFSPFFITGLGMMLVGIGFKLAVVPFHMWTADVYHGAPAPVTAFIATASKGGVFAVMLRFFNVPGMESIQVMNNILLAIAIASMIAGNLLALRQNNVKRVLAYSSIAHLGYLLIAFLPGGSMSIIAVCFYLMTYFVTTLAAFAVICSVSRTESDAEDIEDYRGLFWQRPLLAFGLSTALLSLAGIPLTIGFMGKFYILSAAVNGSYWISAIVLAISSVVGLFYYLRIITIMCSVRKLDSLIAVNLPVPSMLNNVVLILLVGVIIFFGVLPFNLFGFIEILLSKSFIYLQ